MQGQYTGCHACYFPVMAYKTHQPVHLTPKKGTKYPISNGGECTTNSLTMKFARCTKPATSNGKNLSYSLIEARGIDSHLQQEIQLEVDRNKAILERILDVTLFLASRNLPFRGSTETLGGVRDGNFLGTVELVASTILCLMII